MTDKFTQLWTDYLEGDLDPAGLADLQRMLDADPDLCRRAAGLYEDHRLLGAAHRPTDESAFAAEIASLVRADLDRFVGGVTGRVGGRLGPVRNRRRWAGYSLVASITLVTSLAAQWALWPDLPPAVPSEVLGAVAVAPTRSYGYAATLVRADDCQWTGPAPAEGQRLIPGDLELDSGTAVIRLDGGAVVSLAGPSHLRVESATDARLITGTASVRADGVAFGFTLHTPTSDVVDLGTEFAVSVSPAGVTEVHVLEGRVELHPGRDPDDARAVRLLAHGRAVRLDPADPGTVLDIPLTARQVTVPRPDPGRVRPGLLLAYESFDYPQPDPAPGAADGGTGWGSPWCRGWLGNRDRSIQVAPDSSLTPPAGMAEPVGGRAVLVPPRPLVYKRCFADPIDFKADSVRYLSFLVRREASPKRRAADDRWLRVNLTGKGPNWETRAGFGVLTDGRPFAFAKGVPNAVAAGPLAEDRAYLFVGKVVTGKLGPDQFFLKVFGPGDPLDSREPAAWPVATDQAWFDAEATEIHLGFGPHGGFSVDEIRLGTTWESVTPWADNVH